MPASPTAARCPRRKMVTKPSLMMHTPLSPVELTLRYSLFRIIPTKLVWFHQVALAGMASLGQVEATIEHDTESAILTFKGGPLLIVAHCCSLLLIDTWQVLPTFGLELDSTQGPWRISHMLSLWMDMGRWLCQDWSHASGDTDDTDYWKRWRRESLTSTALAFSSTPPSQSSPTLLWTTSELLSFTGFCLVDKKHNCNPPPGQSRVSRTRTTTCPPRRGTWTWSQLWGILWSLPIIRAGQGGSSHFSLPRRFHYRRISLCFLASQDALEVMRVTESVSQR